MVFFSIDSSRTCVAPPSNLARKACDGAGADTQVGSIQALCHTGKKSMQNSPTITPRSSLAAFSIALLGAITGILLGPGIVALFAGAPAWVLPAVMCSATFLAVVAGAVAFKLSTGGRTNGHNPGRKVNN